MKFSEQWLREWCNPSITCEEIVQILNSLGLEVDSAQAVAPPFSGVVVAQIKSLQPHPDADRLRICRVDTGKDEVQVVSGASNAYAGMKAPLAVIGACLPGGLEIKQSKLRGVESFGMLCSETELGLEEKSEGLMDLPQDAPLGMDIRQYLKLDDKIIEVNLTPNRGDCLSIKGIARELAIATGSSFTTSQSSADHRPDDLAHSCRLRRCFPGSTGFVCFLCLPTENVLDPRARLREAGVLH